jgi:hypothetical protein
MTELLRRRIIGIHDDTVREKTGLNWADWFKVLDKAGGRMMDHPNITAYLRQQHGLTKWWSQTVTSGYEQERGIRQKHQKGTKFSVDISKVVAAPLAAVWAAWRDRATLNRWLPGASFQVRSFTQDKIMHLEWPDGTKVDVAFKEKGGRTRTVVTHGRLPEQADIERVRPYWTEALERLKKVVEG